jgi:hypothetical protein
VGLDANIKLVRSERNQVLWERDDFYLDGKATPIEDFKNIPGLLVRRLSEALDRYAGRTVNEVKHPNL